MKGRCHRSKLEGCRHRCQTSVSCMKKKRAGPAAQVNKEKFLRYLLSCQSFAKAARRFNISRQRAQQIGKQVGLEFKIGPKGTVRPTFKGSPFQQPPEVYQWLGQRSSETYQKELGERDRVSPELSQRWRAEHLAAVVDALFRGEDHKIMCDAVALFLRARAKGHQGTIHRRMRKMAETISDLGLYQG